MLASHSTRMPTPRIQAPYVYFTVCEWVASHFSEDSLVQPLNNPVIFHSQVKLMLFLDHIPRLKQKVTNFTRVVISKPCMIDTNKVSMCFSELQSLEWKTATSNSRWNTRRLYLNLSVHNQKYTILREKKCWLIERSDQRDFGERPSPHVNAVARELGSARGVLTVVLWWSLLLLLLLFLITWLDVLDVFFLIAQLTFLDVAFGHARSSNSACHR